MRTDVFSKRKGIHIDIEKEIHLQLRMVLYEKQLSMQQLFNEFARLVVERDENAKKIVDIAARKN